MRFFILFLLSILLFTACQKSAETSGEAANVQRYPFKGKVVSVDKAKKTATIDHEKVPGYMDAMTMSFPVRADWVWEDLTPGAEIRADLVIDPKQDFWLENIGIIAAPNPNQTAPPVDERFAQIGKEIPDFVLTDQDGKKISLKDYRGKALAITFIYAQCPLPDYCILMSKNFSDLALQLEGDAGAADKIRLLSISFDPARDTPEKLRQYGQGYLGNPAKPDFTIWQLATGTNEQVKKIADFFGLRYEISPEDKLQFNHSLRTAVVSPEGKVTKIFPGNDWTKEDLLREMRETLQ